MAAKKTKTNDGDRLSALPDTVLVDILSLLPIKSAISTTVLSRRWLNLWTQVTSFSLTDEETWDMSTIIDGLLRKLTSPEIRKFDLHIISKFRPKYRLKDSWFRFFCDRNVQEIQVVYDDLGCGKWGLLPPPICVFKTTSLIDLRVETGVDCRLPDLDDAINLPNLKILRLRVYACNPVSLARLVSSCPVLEDIYLDLADFCSNDFDVHMSSTSLRRLEIVFHEKSPEGMIKLVIDSVPKLEYLKVHVGSKPLELSFVETPIRLLEANIPCLTYQLERTVMEMFESVSSVTFLAIDWLQLDYPRKLFPNLTRLRLKSLKLGNPNQCKQLVRFLQSCSILEDITLTCDAYVENMPKKTYICADSVLAGVKLAHVKRIEININVKGDYKVALDGLYLIRFFRRVAPVLKHIIVKFNIAEDDQCKKNQDEEWNEYLVSKELFELLKSSPMCRIEFFGKYLSLSTKDKPFG